MNAKTIKKIHKELENSKKINIDDKPEEIKHKNNTPILKNVPINGNDENPLFKLMKILIIPIKNPINANIIIKSIG